MTTCQWCGIDEDKCDCVYGEIRALKSTVDKLVQDKLDQHKAHDKKVFISIHEHPFYNKHFLKIVLNKENSPSYVAMDIDMRNKEGLVNDLLDKVEIGVNVLLEGV